MEIAVKQEMPGPAFLTCDLRGLANLGGIKQQNPAGWELRLVLAARGMDNDFAHGQNTQKTEKAAGESPAALQN